MPLERKFEKFTGGPAARRDGKTARITINHKGDIYINATAYQMFGRPKAVALYYNREDDVIAVEPAYPRFVENFPIIKIQNGYRIHATSFCRHYRIRIPTTERFIRPDVTNEGQLILKLKETVTTGTFKRKLKQDASTDNQI